jgi:hypothetical protein
MAKSTIPTILKNREAIKAADVAKGVKSLTSKTLVCAKCGDTTLLNLYRTKVTFAVTQVKV